MADHTKERVETRKRSRIVPPPAKLDDELVQHLVAWKAAYETMLERGSAAEDDRTVRRIQADKDRFGKQFLLAAERGDAARLLAFIEKGFPADYAHPRTGETALHITAGNGNRRAVRALLSTGQCAFTQRDKKGRLPSELAFIHGDDPAMARLLSIKERAEARAKGIALPRRPKP